MIEKYIQSNPEREPCLSEGIDFYKLTMGQIALEKFAGTEVTFTFQNRNKEHLMSQYVIGAALEDRLDRIRDRGFAPEEIAYFAGLQAQDGSARFDEQYLNYLADIDLPKVNISHDAAGELKIHSTGDWAAVSLWETVIMSEANEEYYERKMAIEGIDVNEVLANGDRILSEKIEILRDRPDIKFADFGTRRRFSAAWQEHVIERLVNELPDNFIGTSNPWFAHKFNIKPIGTYAHEMPMVYAALAEADGKDPLDSHRQMMDDWYARYGKDLSTALTDTFTSDFFFDDFNPEQAQAWQGLRQDSGDPFEFGERVITFYDRLGIDPKTKTIIFSDGLDIDTIIKLTDQFGGRVNIVYGWGTTLMNDLGLKANNIVMKATMANGVGTVKLSDSLGKYTGTNEQIERYVTSKNHRLYSAPVTQEMAVACHG